VSKYRIQIVPDGKRSPVFSTIHAVDMLNVCLIVHDVLAKAGGELVSIEKVKTDEKFILGQKT